MGDNSNTGSMDVDNATVAAPKKGTWQDLKPRFLPKGVKRSLPPGSPESIRGVKKIIMEKREKSPSPTPSSSCSLRNSSPEEEISEEVDSMSGGEMRANGKRSQAKERENPKAKLIALDAESWANIVDTDKDWDLPEEGRPSSSASSAKGAKAKNVAPGEKKRSKGRSRASSKESSRAKEMQTIKTAAAAAAAPAAAAKEGTFVAPARLKRSFSGREWGGNGAVAAEMGDIRADIMRMSHVTRPTVGIKTQLLANRYEEIVGALLIRIGVLEDRLNPIFNTTKEMSEEVDSMSEGEMRANGKRSQAKERENPKAKLIALDAESWANIVDTDKDWDLPEEGRPSSSASSAKGAKAKNVAPGEKKRSKGRSRASSKEASRVKEVQTIKTAAAAAAAPAADAAAAAAKEGTFVAPARLKRSFSDREWGGNGAVAAEMGDIRADIMRMSHVTSPTVGIKTQLLANRYEEILGALLIRIGVLEDRLKIRGRGAQSEERGWGRAMPAIPSAVVARGTTHSPLRRGVAHRRRSRRRRRSTVGHAAVEAGPATHTAIHRATATGGANAKRRVDRAADATTAEGGSPLGTGGGAVGGADGGAGRAREPQHTGVRGRGRAVAAADAGMDVARGARDRTDEGGAQDMGGGGTQGEPSGPPDEKPTGCMGPADTGKDGGGGVAGEGTVGVARATGHPKTSVAASSFDARIDAPAAAVHAASMGPGRRRLARGRQERVAGGN
nr:microtubule-associated protein futsch-like [Drosophila suzukii]